MGKPIAISAALASALALVTAGPAQAQEARVYTGASAWALDYGDDYCRLMRDFEHEGDTLGLFIERTQPGPLLRMIIIGDGVKLYRGAEVVGYRLYPSGAPRTAPLQRLRTSDGQQYLNLGPSMLADVPPPAPGAPPPMPGPYSPEAEAAAAAGITALVLQGGLTDPVRIDTGPLDEAVRALQTCADDLLASWGLDAEAHQRLSRVAMPSVPTQGWLARDTIPFADFAKLAGGNNEIRLMVNQQGEVTSCEIQWPTLDSDVNEEICDLVKQNAQMLPALDQDGNPINSYWVTNVFFLLPPFGG